MTDAKRDEILEEVVRRIAQTVDVQARSWRAQGHEVVLPERFALDVARNATGGLLDILFPEDFVD